MMEETDSGITGNLCPSPRRGKSPPSETTSQPPEVTTSEVRNDDANSDFQLRSSNENGSAKQRNVPFRMSTSTGTTEIRSQVQEGNEEEARSVSESSNTCDGSERLLNRDSDE